MSKLAIKLQAYDHKLVESAVERIINLANDQHQKFSGPIPLPTKREVFTILRSVHVNKKSREQFERRTYKRFIVIIDASKSFMEKLRHIELPAGVQLKFKSK